MFKYRSIFHHEKHETHSATVKQCDNVDCHATLRLPSAIRRHHPTQRAVLRQICCFGERKVAFQILLDGADSHVMQGRPDCFLQSAGGGLTGSSCHLRCRPCA